MTKKVYGISDGYNGMGTGDIFQITAWKDSTREQEMMGKSLEGNWCSLAAVFFINESGEPQQHDWQQFIPEEK